MYFGRLFHIIWNAIPVELEQSGSLKKLTTRAYRVRREKWRLEVGRASW